MTMHLPDTIYTQMVADVGTNLQQGLEDFRAAQGDDTISAVSSLVQDFPDGMTATGKLPVGVTQKDGVDFGRIFYNLKTRAIEYTDNMSDPQEDS